MKNIHKIIFVILMILSVITVSYILSISQNKNRLNNKNSEKNIEQSIKYFNTTVVSNKDDLEKYFKDRFVIINDNELSIGKSKNELENYYYDVNFKIKENYIEIYINKLFKDFDRNIICDEAYVDEIIKYMIKVFDLKIDKKAFSNLIISNYGIIRDIERKTNININKLVVISGINIYVTIYENMLVLKMGDK